MRRLVKYLSILLAGVALVCAGLALGVGWLLDQRTDALLQQISARVPGLELRNEYQEQGLLSKKGRLYVNYRLPDGFALENKLQLAFDYQIRMGLMELGAEFERVSGVGNLKSLISPFASEIPRISGHLKASLFELGGRAEISSAPMVFPLNDGKCALGEIRGQGSFDVTMQAQGSVSLSALECVGSALYNSRSSYYLKLHDLKLQGSPRLSGKRVVGLTLDLRAQEISGEASTLYLIGFNPQDEVKDPTLREGISLKNVAFSLDFAARDQKGFGSLMLASSGDLTFGMPYIREGQILPMQSFEHIKVKGHIPNFNPVALLSELKRESLRLNAVFSNDASAKLENLSFSSGGQELKMSGLVQARLMDGERPQDLSVELEGSAGSQLIDSLIADTYVPQLASLVQTGAVTYVDGSYSTKLQFSHNRLTLNGRALDLVPQDDPENGDEI